MRPHVAGLMCAVNIAFDPHRRLSAHALFSRVSTEELPFSFEQDFYVVVSLRGVPDGERTVGMYPEPGVLEFVAEAAEGKVIVEDGLAVFARSVVSCVVHQAGPQYVTFIVDGEPLEPVFAFQVVQEEDNGD